MSHVFELLVVEPRESGERLDVLILKSLQTTFPAFSRAALKKLFNENRVLLNGRTAAPALRLDPGRYGIEVVNFRESDFFSRALPSPRGCFLNVIYEDDTLLVLNKTSGMPSVPHSADETETAVGAALARFPGLPEIPGKELEPGLLHRLDTLTSGILAFAKTGDEFQRLRKLWKESQVEKVYRAICVADPHAPPPSPPPSLLDWPLAHDAKKAKRMRAVLPGSRPSQIRGQPLPAITRILSSKSLRPSSSAGPAMLARDFEVQITTGVMHQIRCHLSTAKWPIAGDPIYGGSPASRLWLHSWKLSLPLASGQLLRLQAALPESWPQSWP